VWTDSPVNAANCNSFVGGVPLGTFTGTPALTGVVRQPEYVIEYLHPAQDSGSERKNFDCPTALLITSSAGVATADATSALIDAQTSDMPCYLFRITARGFGPTLNAQVLMQSYFHMIKY
jgi:type IV pilus assembly protein PilX